MKLVKDVEKEHKHSEKISEKEAEEAFVKIIKWIGEDPSREGLVSTPKRLIKAFKEYFKGYKEDPNKILEGMLLPFGGYKQSGYSREKGVDALKSYLQVKNVGISLD